MVWCAAAFSLLIVWVVLTLPRLPRRTRELPAERLYAHRGLWNESMPENSLPAFCRAAEAGFGAELDVQLTRDGVPVVFHDDTLARMCGCPGSICEKTLEELRPLRLGGTEYGVPTLAEALDALDGAPLIVEIKTSPSLSELCEKTLRLLRSYPGQFCVESFDPRAVRYFRLHAGDVVRGQLAMGLRAHPEHLTQPRFWLLASLVCNALGRPDFIAHEFSSDRTCAMRLMRILRPTLVCWTIRSQDDLDRARDRYDLQIFEAFLPKR